MKKKSKTDITSEELEKRFEETLKKVNSEIKTHIKNMQENLNDIIKISEKYGVPISVPITPLQQIYKPKSFEKKWKKLAEDNQFLYDQEIDPDAYDGWQHSDIC